MNIAKINIYSVLFYNQALNITIHTDKQVKRYVYFLDSKEKKSIFVILSQTVK